MKDFLFAIERHCSSEKNSAGQTKELIKKDEATSKEQTPRPTAHRYNF